MNNLNHYQREMKAISQDATKTKGKGHGVAWLMMIVGVVVTGTMTYSLTRKGMADSSLWREWVTVAALLPTVLLEGSALALVYGRHHWFRSEEQRSIANAASWAIWILLATTSVVHFAFGSTQSFLIRWLMGIYASYILPLAIVGVPMLWKKLYDAAPDSQMRIAVLEAEAALRSQMVAVEREQNALMVDAYREALDAPRVIAARKALFESASIEHARNIAGFIVSLRQNGVGTGFVRADAILPKGHREASSARQDLYPLVSEIMAIRLVADIKPEFQNDNIKYLVLEEDTLGSGGYFIFLHERLDAPCLYDHWYMTIEDAKSAASEMWGILEGDWKSSSH